MGGGGGHKYQTGTWFSYAGARRRRSPKQMSQEVLLGGQGKGNRECIEGKLQTCYKYVGFSYGAGYSCSVNLRSGHFYVRLVISRHCDLTGNDQIALGQISATFMKPANV